MDPLKRIYRALGYSGDPGERINMRRLARILSARTETVRRRLVSRGAAAKVGGRYYTTLEILCAVFRVDMTVDGFMMLSEAPLDIDAVSPLPPRKRRRLVAVGDRYTGKRGHFTVVEVSQVRHPKSGKIVMCECNCGQRFLAHELSILRGKISTCGHWRK